jgi:hypothetical protein
MNQIWLFANYFKNNLLALWSSLFIKKAKKYKTEIYAQLTRINSFFDGVSCNDCSFAPHLNRGYLLSSV